MLEKRSLSLAGHRTSVALEPEFWAVLEQAAAPGSLAALVALQDAARAETGEPLASQLRLFALRYALARAGSAAAGR
jgi:predicted DNA-binding ribbon-helix-helix protein